VWASFSESLVSSSNSIRTKPFCRVCEGAVRDEHRKADATQAIVVSECEFDTLIVLWSEIPTIADVIDDAMTSGRGGEYTSTSATGVRCVQRRERPRWDANSRMRSDKSHLRQTCISLYHHRSRRHCPPLKMRISLVPIRPRNPGDIEDIC